MQRLTEDVRATKVRKRIVFRTERTTGMDWAFFPGGNTALVRFRATNKVMLVMAPFDGEGCFINIINPDLNYADSRQKFECLAADFIRGT